MTRRTTASFACLGLAALAVGAAVIYLFVLPAPVHVGFLVFERFMVLLSLIGGAILAGLAGAVLGAWSSLDRNHAARKLAAVGLAGNLVAVAAAGSVFGLALLEGNRRAARQDALSAQLVPQQRLQEVVFAPGFTYAVKLEQAQACIAQGAQIDHRDVSDSTLLMAACRSSPGVEELRLLVELGADVNAVNGAGWTALHFAASHGHVEAARALVAAGADPRARTNDGESALDVARSRAPGFPGLLEILRLPPP